ncbi:MAG: hypothetical protein RL598_880 [Verrucomicrobiota bacterium]|jgi:hypothetical protein
MLLIRRMDDGKRSYTAIFLPGEPAQMFPTTDQEHARILQIYKQDRPHQDVMNDFSEYQIGHDRPIAPPKAVAPKPPEPPPV